jgi:hypothetical protein
MAKASSVIDERSWVLREAQRFALAGEPSAILVPNHELAQALIKHACVAAGLQAPEFPRVGRGRFGKTDYGIANDHMAQSGLVFRFLGSGYGELEEGEQLVEWSEEPWFSLEEDFSFWVER